MIFGGAKARETPKQAPSMSHAPVDFMHEPSWTKIANGVTHGHLNAGDISRLPREERDYVYRLVAHLESDVTVDQALRWYHDAPNGVTAGLVGAAKVRMARRIRRGRRVFDMSTEETERYQVILADAETFLVNATAKYPDSLMPWIPRIDIARGKQMGLDEIKRRFAEAQSRESWNMLACEAAFEGHTPRWAGTYEQLFDFAADAMSAPSGHPARAMIAFAEAERQIRGRNLDVGLMPTRQTIDFHAQFGAFVRNIPERPGPDVIVALGAWLFILTPRDAKDAGYLLQALGLLQRRCGGFPYSSLNDPVAWFQRIVTQREAEARALV